MKMITKGLLDFHAKHFTKAIKVFVTFAVMKLVLPCRLVFVTLLAELPFM